MRISVMLAAAIATSLAGSARAETIKFHGAMSVAAEVPPKSGDGKGVADVALDSDTKIATYDVTYTGLSGPPTMGHLHGPATEGANAPVMVPFSQPLTSPIHGTATLTDAQVADLMAGRMYANVHTASNPGGEIRGQLTKQ